MLLELNNGKGCESRSRMVSFRIKAEEFETFRRLCRAKGVRSVSELVRLAVNQLVAEDVETMEVSTSSDRTSIAGQLLDFECRLRFLESRLALADQEAMPFRPSPAGERDQSQCLLPDH